MRPEHPLSQRKHVHTGLAQDAGGLVFDFDKRPRGGDLPVLDMSGGPAGVGAAHSMLSLCRTTRNLRGREQQVEAVLGSLHRHGAAVIWGSPGEGKTAIATEAGCRLQEDPAAAISLSVVIDMNGVHAYARTVQDTSCVFYEISSYARSAQETISLRFWSSVFARTASHRRLPP